MAVVPRLEHSNHNPADILADIAKLLTEQLSVNTILLLTGDSGSGKSQVLRSVSEFAQSKHHLYIQHDFYPVSSFRASAIEATIRAAFEEQNAENRQYFTEYDKLREQITLGYQAGSAFATSQDDARKAFIQGYNAVAKRSHQPIVLLIDNAEYAVDLDDQAASPLLGNHREANWGGESWLRSILPQLTNTVTVLGGSQYIPNREFADGTPVVVSYYEDTNFAISANHRYNTIQLNQAESNQYLQELLEAVRKGLQSSWIVRRAIEIDLNDPKIEQWHQLAQGNLFWLALCLCAEIIDSWPNHHQISRTTLISQLFSNAHTPVNTEHNILQNMVHLRKGLTADLLTHISASTDTTAILQNVALFPVVRNVKFEGVSRLVLHEEIYRQIDRLQFAIPEKLIDQVIDWHNQQLQIASDEQRLLIDRLNSGSSTLSKSEKGDQARQRTKKLDQRFAVEVDRLFYIFSKNRDDGLQEYNVMAYNAILHRNYGFNVTLRQEGLRNLYRLYPKGFPREISVNNGAFWLLRAAHSDPLYVKRLRDNLPSAFYNNPQYFPQEQYRQQFAFLRLAEAQSIILGYASIGDLREAGEFLEFARKSLQSLNNEDKWNRLLHAQVEHWRGVYFAEQYQYQDAISAYVASLRVGDKDRSRGLRAFTKAYLASALAEQGEINDATRIGRAALLEQQKYAWDYHLALSYVFQAKIEIRAGRVIKANEYAQSGVELLKDLKSTDRLIDALLILAESQRKMAEDLTDNRAAQFAMFKKALTTADDTKSELKNITVDTDRTRAQQRRCDLAQLRGCIYRSRGLAYTQINNERAAKAEFRKAIKSLKEAYHDADSLPTLVQIDILEDLASALVGLDPNHTEIETTLQKAISLVDDSYRLQEGIGLRTVQRPINGFWKELGQCELQYIMMAFALAPAEPRRNVLIGEHLLKMTAYLAQYGQNHWMLQRAEEQVLGRLALMDDTQLGQVISSARKTSDAFQLTHQNALQRVEDLIRRARRDRTMASA